jgi:hypothetical protein
LRVFGAASPSVAGDATETSDASLPAFELLFLTARLRGDSGSIAITVKSSTPIPKYWLALAQVSLSKFFYRSHSGLDTQNFLLKNYLNLMSPPLARFESLAALNCCPIMAD